MPTPTHAAVLVRHGETEWSRDQRHTGWTDIPLTERGREQARAAGRALAGRTFAAVRCSPLQRARETCTLAGFDSQAVIDPDLREWNYGDYEGKTTAEIHARRPGWVIWDGVEGGETLDQVAQRAERVIAEISDALARGDVLLIGHGHQLRILATRWIELQPIEARRFALDTAAISTLGVDREIRAVLHWNDIHHLASAVGG